MTSSTFQSTPSGGKATPHRRYAPDAAQNAPGASQKPPGTARAPSAGAYGGARTDQYTRPRQRYAPALRAVSIHAFRGEGDRARTSQKPAPRQTPPGTRQEPARSPHRARRRPERARSQPEARTARAPSAGAYGGARTDRRTSPRQRYAPALRAVSIHAFRGEGDRARTSQKPVPRARRPLARIVARAPTGVPARTDVTRQKPPRTRQEPAASAYRTLLRFSTITDPVRIRLRRPGIA
jgi:hypothetical protein